METSGPLANSSKAHPGNDSLSATTLQHSLIAVFALFLLVMRLVRADNALDAVLAPGVLGAKGSVSGNSILMYGPDGRCPEMPGYCTPHPTDNHRVFPTNLSGGGIGAKET